MNKLPKISIVGAGPGDADLLTIKAMKAIKSADVIMYDALVGTEILSLAPKDCKKIYVGKRASKHAYDQDEINEMIVSNALIYGHVVRLKGGDPFVFGRGGEEMEYVRKAGLHAEIIPGISSATGVPGISGIPVTHRGISESFWVVTATDQSGNLAKDIRQAAGSDATIVVLMGMSKLDQITRLFSIKGKGKLPVAIIQNGSKEDQRVIIGNIDNIYQKSKKALPSAATIIIIGEVVHLYHPAQLVHQYQTVVA
ncbi:MAG: uroporphyrinogen-III C-methyltransferase [Saprospiraceae bacterium]